MFSLSTGDVAGYVLCATWNRRLRAQKCKPRLHPKMPKATFFDL